MAESTHIHRYGDSDILPVPFEFDAMRTSWPQVRQHIESADMNTWATGASRRFLVPKPQVGFRVAIQLDPVDSLVFAALTYEAAEKLEAIRASKALGVANSYRLGLDATGNLFEAKGSWQAFHLRSLELANSPGCTFVVETDISDFYNQISHHRVCNALETAGCSEERARNFENFLMNLTGGQSRGLPVGPAASIILAEGCMADVDSHLMTRGYRHTRYVDDIRIFCSNQAQAVKALHDLSEYLYTAHRLALQGGKTFLQDRETFLKFLEPPPEQARNNLHAQKAEQVQKFLSRFHSLYGDFEASDPNEKEQLEKLELETLGELTEVLVQIYPLKAGLARYALRQAARINSRHIYPVVLNNLATLAPVFRDVVRYLKKTAANPRAVETVANSCLEFYRESSLSFLPFIQEWLVDLAVARLGSSDAHRQAVRAMCEAAGVRAAALYARAQKQVDWVRARKEDWRSHASWDRRAILWSSAALSRDERTNWLNRARTSATFLEDTVAKSVLNQ